LEVNERITINIADLGNATWAEHHFTGNIQAQQYHYLGVVLDAKLDTSGDIWSVTSVVFRDDYRRLKKSINACLLIVTLSVSNWVRNMQGEGTRAP